MSPTNIIGIALGAPTIITLAYLFSQCLSRVRERPGMPIYGDVIELPIGAKAGGERKAPTGVLDDRTHLGVGN